MQAEEKGIDTGSSTMNHEQHEEMKNEQYKESEHAAHEQNEEMKHPGNEKNEGMKHQGHEQHEEITHERHEGMKHEAMCRPRGKTMAIIIPICLRTSERGLSFLLY